MTMFLMFSAPCAAVITKPTLRKVTNAKRKRNSMTKLNVISAVSKAQTQAALTTAARITPMTDITELAQSLKRRAASANEFGESLYVKADDVIALVEALEKAQQTEKTLKSRNCRLEGIITAAENRISELGKTIAEQDKRLINYAEISTRNAERAAELESRTVKLPDLRQIVSGDRYVWSDGVYNYSQDVKVALAAAGIKVEAE
ncbi:ead/Ea22-like family protein [Klebsiella pneumoniae]|nr:ead/Ea22-like family protein [Klebsiella pneumoniae]MBG9431404.1 ead/Ea22-like family protein [Klebsiella pneumoniae]HDI2368864.1 ead/Ea22-like family protein [Klebsiella pneumoniae]HDI2416206.1 ead/Ea22-like family protein [Klebsiella pneumoniae]HDI2430264.1 ead/Ea22-like family protein [Klebsiella pneumoniae]HDI2761531.1 ead/Ea22-like family protein [Klebsiella pneumoniae]